MRKAFTLILLLFYFLTSCGVLITQRFCGDTFKDISFLLEPSSDACCKDVKENSCCDEESFIVKIKEAHTQQEKIKASKDVYLLDIPKSFFQYAGVPLLTNTISENYAPPNGTGLIYLFIRVFLI